MSNFVIRVLMQVGFSFCTGSFIGPFLSNFPTRRQSSIVNYCLQVPPLSSYCTRLPTQIRAVVDCPVRKPIIEFSDQRIRRLVPTSMSGTRRRQALNTYHNAVTASNDDGSSTSAWFILPTSRALSLSLGPDVRWHLLVVIAFSSILAEEPLGECMR